jgi:hypothetical protein
MACPDARRDRSGSSVQQAMAGHLRIGKGAQIGAQAGMISDVKPGATMLGSPAQLKQVFLRQVAFGRRAVVAPDWCRYSASGMGSR